MSSPIDYRIPRKSVYGTSDGNLFWTVIEKVWPDIAEPDEMKRLQHATPGQAALFVVTLFIREVDNGGLEQFFWNSSGDLGDEVIKGFERLGSPERAEIVRQALTFFNSAPSTPNQSVRREFLSKKSKVEKNAFFEPLNENLLWPLLRRYLDNHPEEFFVDSAGP
jgi:hypothetical protein